MYMYYTIVLFWDFAGILFKPSDIIDQSCNHNCYALVGQALRHTVVVVMCVHIEMCNASLTQ